MCKGPTANGVFRCVIKDINEKLTTRLDHLLISGALPCCIILLGAQKSNGSFQHFNRHIYCVLVPILCVWMCKFVFDYNQYQYTAIYYFNIQYVSCGFSAVGIELRRTFFHSYKLTINIYFLVTTRKYKTKY